MAAKFDLLTTLTLNATGFSDGINKAKKEAAEMKTAIVDSASAASEGINDLTGGATAGITSMISKLLSVSGPFAAVGAGIALITAPIGAFFSSSEEGMDLLAQGVSVFKSQINVLKGYMIELGRSMVDSDDSPGKKVGLFGKIFNDVSNVVIFGAKLIIATIPGATKAVDDLSKKLKGAAIAAASLTYEQQKEEEEEINLIVARAKSNLQIVEAREKYAEATGTIDERVNLLKKAQDIEGQTAADEIKLAKEQWHTLQGINKEKDKTHQLTREDQRLEAEAEAKIYELQAESDRRLIRNKKAVKTLLEEEIKLLKAATNAPKENAIDTHSGLPINVAGDRNFDTKTKNSMEAMAERAKRANKAIIESNKDLANSYNILGDVMSAVKSSQENFTNTLLAGANSFKDYVKNIKGSIKELIGAYIAEGVAKMILKAIDLAATAGPFAIFAAAALAKLGAGIAKTAFNSLIPSFASGGISAGGLALVGEKGPELVNLPMGSRVIPNNQSFGNKTLNVVVTGKIGARDIYLSGYKYALELDQNT